MKISKDLEKLMIEQIRNEFESAYIYLGMSAAMESLSYPGTAEWMRKQSKEEVEHGMRFYDYLLSRSSAVELLPIAKVVTIYKTPLAVFQAALEHEKKITAMIHKMYDLAISVKDYESQNMLNWFIAEQVEEEKQTQYFVDRFTLAGEYRGALLQIDKEAGSRES